MEKRIPSSLGQQQESGAPVSCAQTVHFARPVKALVLEMCAAMGEGYFYGYETFPLDWYLDEYLHFNDKFEHSDLSSSRRETNHTLPLTVTQIGFKKKDNPWKPFSSYTTDVVGEDNNWSYDRTHVLRGNRGFDRKTGTNHISRAVIFYYLKEQVRLDVTDQSKMQLQEGQLSWVIHRDIQYISANSAYLIKGTIFNDPFYLVLHGTRSYKPRRKKGAGGTKSKSRSSASRGHDR